MGQCWSGNQAGNNPPQTSLCGLRRATNSFSNIERIDEGGSAIVHREPINHQIEARREQDDVALGVILHSYISDISNLRVPVVLLTHQNEDYSELVIPFPRRVFRVSFSSSNCKVLGHSPNGLWLIFRTGLRVSFYNGVDLFWLPNLPNGNDNFAMNVDEYARITTQIPTDAENTTLLLAFPHLELVLNRFFRGQWTRRTIMTEEHHVPRGVVLFRRDWMWLNAANTRLYRIVDVAVDPNGPVEYTQPGDEDRQMFQEELYYSALGQDCLYFVYFHQDHEVTVVRVGVGYDFGFTEIDISEFCVFTSLWGEGLLMPPPCPGMRGRIYVATHERSDLGWMEQFNPHDWHTVRRCMHMEMGECHGESYWFVLDYNALCVLEHRTRSM